MEVRDPVHGSIKIHDNEIPVIDDPFFQRLRRVRQLGLSENAFPGATHTRFLHSIGVMQTGSIAFGKIFHAYMDNIEIKRLHATFRLACLLHDIGHAPLSHATESVMPQLDSLALPDRFRSNAQFSRQATHEDYTIKAITDSSFSESFKSIKLDRGVNTEHVAELIYGKTHDPSYFTFKGINYFPLLHQLISSELDCDRMDYLLRDSYFCGVSYGKYDLDWILDNIIPCIISNTAYLGINERAIATFDDFLLSRFHMFLMIYFHYKSVCLEQLLLRYFQSAPGEYSIPSNIEEYREHDDHKLMTTLKASKNEYAQRIINGRQPKKIYECFGPQNTVILDELIHYLKSEDIDYIHCSSTGRLSKYYLNDDLDRPTYTLKVVKQSSFGIKKNFIEIDQATNLFQKFSEAHSVDRIHTDFEILTKKQQQNIFFIIDKGI